MPEDPILERVFCLGKASLYVLKASRPPLLDVLITPYRGKYYFDLAGQGSPLCHLVISLNEAIEQNATQFGPVKNLEGYHCIELPPMFGDEDCKHPANLYFKGMPYEAKVYPLSDEGIEALPSTNNPKVDGAVKFYAKAWQTLAEGDVEGFANMLSKKDGDFVREHNQSDENYKKSLMAFFVGNPRRHVKYIIYSDNVFWLFYEFSPGPYRQTRLSYNMIVWDDVTEKYQIVRIFAYLDAVHDLMMWEPFAKEMIENFINRGK